MTVSGLNRLHDLSSIIAPKVLVAQLGARRHYLVPATFHSRGMLERFVTDLYLSAGWVQRAVRKLSQVIPASGLRRLTGRQDVDLPTSLVTSFAAFGMQYKVRARLATHCGMVTGAWLWAGREFSKRVVQQGWGRADAVYAYSSAALEIFEAAKREGKLCILDYATAPKRFEDALTAQQATRYENWAAKPPCRDGFLDEYADRQNQEAELADVIVCGSSFVKHAIECESGQGHKSVVVPLGLRSLPMGVTPRRPVYGRPLRLLFVGDEAIRKGIGDLCRAVEQFGRQRCEVRVVGNIDLSAFGREQASHTVELLGSVPRKEMRRQYEWADVCLLPSVSDTFGLVVLEAMSYGVPVITTPNTGAADVVEDGKNGFVVPVMSPDHIAQRLEMLDTERDRLSVLSENVIIRSADFSIDRYAQKLVAVVREAFLTRTNGSHV